MMIIVIDLIAVMQLTIAQLSHLRNLFLSNFLKLYLQVHPDQGRPLFTQHNSEFASCT
jgi:hypothetical protein